MSGESEEILRLKQQNADLLAENARLRARCDALYEERYTLLQQNAAQRQKLAEPGIEVWKAGRRIG